MIEAWSLLDQLPFGVRTLSHLGWRRWNSNLDLSVATWPVLENAQCWTLRSRCVNVRDGLSPMASIFVGHMLQTLLCIRIQMTCRSPRSEQQSPLFYSPRQRIVTMLVGAYDRTTSSESKLLRVLSMVEGCVRIGQLHTLGDSNRFSSVKCACP